MIVQNDGGFIRLSNEFVWELVTREEALQLLEELTEAIRMCPVGLKTNADLSLRERKVDMQKATSRARLQAIVMQYKKGDK
jgi:hypothetical protein